MNDLHEYRDFINNKAIVSDSSGFMIDRDDLNPKLYPFQMDIVRWALAKGKSAIFADCGLGKTAMQLEWSKHICNRTKGSVLILAPLAVTTQTAREGIKFDIDVTICEKQDDVKPGINITNYEKLDKFDTSVFFRSSVRRVLYLKIIYW